MLKTPGWVVAEAAEEPAAARIPAPKQPMSNGAFGGSSSLKLDPSRSNCCRPEREQVPRRVEAEDVRDQQLAPVRRPDRDPEVLRRIDERYLMRVRSVRVGDEDVGTTCRELPGERDLVVCTVSRRPGWCRGQRSQRCESCEWCENGQLAHSGPPLPVDASPTDAKGGRAGANRGGPQSWVRACTEIAARGLVLATMRPGVASATIGVCARPC